jgi:glyoxylase-like metal-dependent hydrolase (beta-lactamase superfamily II)
MLSLIPFDVVSVGILGGDAFLVVSEDSALLVETGFAFSADDMISELKLALGARRLDYVLLTHSHYDHVGGVPAVKRAFPDAVIVSSELASHIFAKESARRTMRLMDESAATHFGYSIKENLFPFLKTDLAVNDGDVLETADIHVKVISSPGHTRDSVDYYFKELGLLVCSESSGVLLHDGYYPSYIVSYAQALRAIEKIEEINPKFILAPHFGLVSGDEVKAYPIKMREVAEASAEFILSRYRAGNTENEILEDYIKHYYRNDINKTAEQPVEAFTANAEVLVPRLIAEAYRVD